MRLIKAKIEQMDKSLEIMKIKKLEHIVRLAKVEQEIKSLVVNVKKQLAEVKINKPSRANISMVRAFYASMVQDQFSASNVVMARGVPVVVSTDKIHTYFDLPSVQREIEGYPNTFLLGSELCMDSGIGWNGNKLLHKHLLFESVSIYFGFLEAHDARIRGFQGNVPVALFFQEGALH
ncbi:hypothetical protein Ddye_021323 [Dipteronia dyeriana]|uniref:Uncharacterized protein n=1 Tax=Dipteronia dyeriana TaxID=168575 RepID=A0AAD9WXE6_9ROSI|nr:hypothetical protein Ddye_021323 [Dipteronia dyeriana]